MKREQLTNVTTESICNDLAYCSMLDAKYLTHGLTQLETAEQFKRAIIRRANTIIALRSQQVTP
jgi:hypothetical protein